MKANKFVKRFGWDYAKHILLEDSVILVDLDYHNLKGLIESHNLVEKYGGLISLKAWVKQTKSDLSLATYFHCNKPSVLIQIENAEKAIADVESCL